MKNLFKLFMKTEGITVKQLAEYGEQALSMRFNEWVKDLGNRRNKNISNEANKFMIRKWIVNGTFSTNF